MRTRRGALTASVALSNVFDKSAQVYGAATDCTLQPGDRDAQAFVVEWPIRFICGANATCYPRPAGP